MIISFFPGSGGHRYKLFLKGLPFDKQRVHMHNNEIAFTLGKDYAFLYESTPVSDIDDNYLVTTHTMTSWMLKEKFLDHTITKIFYDLKSCLRRNWEVSIKHNYTNLPIEEQIDGMFQLIKVSREYYEKYPVDRAADNIVDIATDTTLYGETMRKELDVVNTTFDFVWDVYQKFGSNAPIIDIAKCEFKT